MRGRGKKTDNKGREEEEEEEEEEKMAVSSLRSLYPLACLFLIGFQVVVINCEGARATQQVAETTVESFKTLQGPSTHRITPHQNVDPFSASKRRVPDGSDPIHNRYCNPYLHTRHDLFFRAF